MPNFPTTADECKSLSIAFLRESGLLRPGFHVTTLRFSCNGQPTGSVGLEVNLVADTTPYVRLHYTHDKTTDYDYRIPLEALPSNLPGHGHRTGRYRMRCPVSGKAATVLYLHGGTGYFAHRLAYPGQQLHYDSQLTPHRLRHLIRPFALDRKVEDAYMSQGKYRKTHYRGKPTRWYAQRQALEARSNRAACMGALAVAGGQFDPMA
ncbi:hypothetical protein [Hymenobacter nivis]|uniref:Uncharacterized protein n=1 Tax=Hymenobacter nivis TaxID=1850093 RepID=A0A2Z3GGV7_9BACT|nr:hypothetical protein [Hymenobacter nivis]AWM31391.1 hypothetical protein DDQ68_00465 [Hymenobacter nivis]